LLSLEALVLSLQEEIRLLKNGKKSGTSHTSPSHDISRSNAKSLREQSDKKTGGQAGHQGSTLQMSINPDEIIEYKSNYCSRCSCPLNMDMAVLQDRRQEVDIPLVQARYIEHRSYSTQCICGHENRSDIPSHLKSPIQYGSGVQATVAYLFSYQYLSYSRIKQTMSDCFNISLSEGTIDNLLEKLAVLAEPIYDQIQSRLKESKVVGGDETGTKINGQKGWFHVWQNKTLTFIVASATRGYATAETFFSQGFKRAVYVSDCWSGQLKTPAIGHQLCLVHLLRELTNFEDALKCEWSAALKQLFKRAIKIKQELRRVDYLNPPPIINQLEIELQKMLEVDTSNFHKKSKAFVKRLIKNKESIFTFLSFEHVPYDNNGAERAIRNIKVKTKISGSFRSQQGANRYAILRSVIDTAIKNGQDVFSALKLIAQTIPE
jgi:transposase